MSVHYCRQCGETFDGAAVVAACPHCSSSEGASRLETDASLYSTRPSVSGEQSGEAASVQPPAATPGYEVGELLGRGGMGVVYRARQQSLQRDVALKLVSAPAATSQRSLERFRREAKAAGGLQHPNIVRVIDYGLWSDGRPYYAMELVDGGSLADRIAEQGAESPESAARLMLTLADAVAAAHAAGVLHRDLKPANILLDSMGEPKIADFGLAKELAESTPEATIAGDILGTPAYMSPEQAGGVARVLTPACDVYSLGVIMYELLTGKLPLQGSDTVDTLLRVLSEEPPAPRRLNARIPRDLETICLTCLQKRPAKRYADAAALADDLRRYLRREPISVRPIGPAEKAWKWARRRPARAVAVVAATLLAVAAVLGLAIHNRRMAAELANTRREWRRAEAGVVAGQDAVDSLVAAIRKDSVDAADLADQMAVMQAAADFCRELLVKEPGRRALAWRVLKAERQLGDLATLAGQYDEAETHYAAAEALLKKADPASVGPTESIYESAALAANRGWLALRRDDAAAAESRFLEAESFLSDEVLDGEPRLAAMAVRIWSNHAVLLAQARRWEAVAVRLTRALDWAERSEQPALLVQFADVNLRRGDPVSAAATLNEALDKLPSEGGTSRERLIRMMAIVRRGACGPDSYNNTEAAEAAVDDAMFALRAGASIEVVAEVLPAFAWRVALASDAGDGDSSAAVMQRLRIAQIGMAPEARDLVSEFEGWLRAKIAFAAGDSESAEQALEQAIALAEQTPFEQRRPDQHEVYAELLDTAAAVLIAREDFAAASRYAAEAEVAWSVADSAADSYAAEAEHAMLRGEAALATGDVGAATNAMSQLVETSSWLSHSRRSLQLLGRCYALAQQVKGDVDPHEVALVARAALELAEQRRAIERAEVEAWPGWGELLTADGSP